MPADRWSAPCHRSVFLYGVERKWIEFEVIAVQLFVQIVLAIFVGVPIGWIWYEYIIATGKTVKEGLSDWFHESDGDI